MSKFFGAPRMPAITGQLQRSAGVMAVLAAVLTVFRCIAVARRMLALMIFSHVRVSFRLAVALKRLSGWQARITSPPLADVRLPVHN